MTQCPPSEVDSRLHSFDWFKALAIFGVVCGHALMFFNVTGVFEGDRDVFRGLGFVNNTIFRFAVPVFAMISGYLFAAKTSIAPPAAQFQYYKGYVGRIVRHYATWYVLYALLELVVAYWMKGRTAGEFFTERISLFDFVYLGDALFDFFWFLPALIFSTTVVFVVRRTRYKTHLFVVSFVLHLVGLFGSDQIYSVFYGLPFPTRHGLFFTLFYCALGGWFFDVGARRWQVSNRLLVVVAVISTVLLVAERFFVASQSNFEIPGDYFLLALPQSVALFLYALANPKLGVGTWPAKTGKDVLGVYLLHSVVLYYTWMGFSAVSGVDARTSLFFNLVTPFFAYAMSYYLWIGPSRIRQVLSYTEPR